MTGWLAPAIAACTGAAVGATIARVSTRLASGAIVWPAIPVMVFEAALYAWGAAVSEAPVMAALSIILGGALSVLALVDVSILRLPDVITLPLIVLGLVGAALEGGDFAGRCIGAGTGFLALWALAAAFRHLRGREGIGMGDAKLLAAAGAWLGWRALPWMVLLACAAAFTWVAARWLVRGGDSLKRPLPFGAPLALSFWIVWLYGAPQA